MGKTQKKNSKGRLDRYYYLAKEKGYRARSSFKIIQINEKYGHFLEKSKVVVDLCAAPGSWCQVASNLCPINSLIIGVDIVPIKPLPNCITFQSDITTEDCRSKLRGHLKTWKADTVLHDGAPNVGLGWVQDAFTQSQLVLKALRLATEHLIQGGTFVTKVFRSKDYNNLMWVFQQLFDKVEATKPPSSRNVSAEIFVVCQGYKAPKKLDPRLLELKEVFEEVALSKSNNEAKVFNPEKHTRKRQGYEEGDNLLYKEIGLLEFVKSEEPINVLGTLNKLVEPPKEDQEWKILRKLRHCTAEFLECIKDLKVLGKKDFKLILKFRKEARDILGLDDRDDTAESGAAATFATEDDRINAELDKMAERLKQKKRREKKRANELKQKEIKRAQMNMMTDMTIGIEAGQGSKDSTFSLVSAKRSELLRDLLQGKKNLAHTEQNAIDFSEDSSADGEVDSETEIDNLEALLDFMYEQYKQKRAEKSSHFKAKMMRGDAQDEPWDGIESSNEDSHDDVKLIDSESESEREDSDEQIREIVQNKIQKDTTKDTALFFASNPVFDEVLEDELLDEFRNASMDNGKCAKETTNSDIILTPDLAELANRDEEDGVYESDEKSIMRELRASQAQRQRVDIHTVEAMTLAHQVALGKMNSHDLVDEGITKYSFRDTENLPEWFIEDEKMHSKVVKPITKEAAAAIKEKLKEMNARPIKKVLEAQGRKKMRALRRLEKLKKKSDLINEDSAKSEKDKAEEILRMMRKLTKKQKVKPKTTLVVAKGTNRGLSGRPKGVKGKYKMVDGVMKNEQRALRRIAKKHKN